MTPHRIAGIVFAAALVLFAPGAHAADAIRKETIRFPKGASSTTVKARIEGDEIVDYVLRAAAGQTLEVRLRRSNPSNGFNVLPPGSSDVAMFVGQAGEDYKGMLPGDGNYAIRVYLVRAAARRNESSDYTLSVSVTGKALAPVPAAQDAVIPGTPYHARTFVDCVPPYGAGPQQCEAFVVRRGFDGTATVEVRAPSGQTRRILFVKGEPVASDALAPMTFTRTGDVTVVRFGDDERYDVFDALVRGG